MAFTGKSTYTAGAALPEIAEDVSDLIGIVSPHETPLLDHLGDPRTVARSTVHEWLEDALLPNTDTIDQATFTPDGFSATQFGVDHAERFRVGDQIRAADSTEVMMVTAVGASTITVVRGYGGTNPVMLNDNQPLLILGNAALEGADKPDARFTTRARKRNYTQIFTAPVDVSGSQLAVDTIGIADELDYQKQQRLRELLRDLENCVINGIAPSANPEGSDTVRRTMNGILPQIVTNEFVPGIDPIPDGSGDQKDELNEAVLNAALRTVWEQSSGTIDTIVCSGAQKRRINAFTTAVRGYEPKDTTYRDLINTYESDYGVCRIVLSRWVPSDAVLLIDSSRISVLPLSGRSFHYKPLAATGDSESGLVLGEYTLQLMNENAHAVIRGLGV
ncbi:MAG: DUF5309 family protein [Phycisphaerales bacterium JB050]